MAISSHHPLHVECSIPLPTGLPAGLPRAVTGVMLHPALAQAFLTPVVSCTRVDFRTAEGRVTIALLLALTLLAGFHVE